MRRKLLCLGLALLLCMPVGALEVPAPSAVLMEAAGKPVWKVTLQLHGGGYAYAQLDAKTGAALITDTARTAP